MGFSPESWNSVANFVLIISLMFGVIATTVIVITGKKINNKFKLEISENSVKFENAKLDLEKETLKRVEVELELEKLRLKLRNRSLTVKQREILISSLSQLAGTQVSVTSLGDKEASEYAEQVISVLTASGIKVIRSTCGSISPPCYGIIIPTTYNFSAFSKAFKEADVEYQLSQYDTQIIIGLKPPIDP